MNTMNKLSRPFVAAILCALLTVTTVLAASSLILRGYQVDFIEVVKDGNNTTWTYAITSDGDEPFGLSHWTLDLDLACGYTIIAPEESPSGTNTYFTPTSYVPQSGPNAGVDICAGIYNCQAASFNIEYGVDATTGVNGVKFQEPDPALSAGNQATQIFQITVANSNPRIGPVDIAIKTGGGSTGYEIGTIDGPVCYPTALTLSNLNASANSGSLLLTSILAASLALASMTAIFGLKFKLAIAN